MATDTERHSPLEEEDEMPALPPRKTPPQREEEPDDPPPPLRKRSKLRIPNRRKKKRAIKLLIALICCLFAVCVAGVCLWFFLFSPLKEYRRAEALLAKEKYAEAFEEFKSLGSFKDSETRLKECLYLQGKALREEKKFKKANEFFVQILDFKDSKSLVHTCTFALIDGKQATCTEDGYERSLCTECSEESLRPLEKTGHVYTPSTCTEPKRCQNCGESSGSPLGHSLEGDVCTRCGLTAFEPRTFSGTGRAVLTGIRVSEGNCLLTGKATLTKGYAGSFYGTLKKADGTPITTRTESLFDTQPTAEWSIPLQGPLDGILEIEADEGVAWTVTLQ